MPVVADFISVDFYPGNYIYFIPFTLSLFFPVESVLVIKRKMSLTILEEATVELGRSVVIMRRHINLGYLGNK